MSSAKHLALPALALLVVAGFWLWRGTVDTSASTTPAFPDTPPATGSRHRGADEGVAVPEPTVRKPAGAAPAVSERTRTERRDRATTDALRQQLRTLQRQAPRRRDGSGAPPAEGDHAEPAEPNLDPEYIQARVREDLLPIAQECYESALEDDPKLGGTLTMTFAIVGDPSVGGVVDEANTDPSSEISDPALLECMRESMLSLSFPAPDDAGRVEVTYPFVFAPDAPAGAPAGAPR